MNTLPTIAVYETRLSLLGAKTYLVLATEFVDDTYWTGETLLLTQNVDLSKPSTSHSLSAPRGMTLEDFSTPENFTKRLVEFAEAQLDVALFEKDNDEYFRLFSASKSVEFVPISDSDSALAQLVIYGPDSYITALRAFYQASSIDEVTTTMSNLLRLRNKIVFESK